ncbi:class I SAM-dependent methyltransferase [Bacillus sp. FSL W7-1360]
MIVTTARKQAHTFIAQAKKYAETLAVPLVPREDRSLQSLFEQVDSEVLVVGAEKLSLHKQGVHEPFFYHPNAALVRYKQWRHTKRDPLIEAADLRAGDSFLDGTLGMAADAVMAQLAVGPKGRVIGVEADPRVAFIVREGLQSWADGDYLDDFTKAMRTIEVVCAKSTSYLQQCPDRSIDVIYFDPMFQVAVASPGIAGLRAFAHGAPLDDVMMTEARRVARRAIVLKDHRGSEQFARYGYTIRRRLRASFQYGVLKV